MHPPKQNPAFAHPWLTQLSAPMLAALWIEAGLAYPHLPRWITLVVPTGFLGWYPKAAGALLLPWLATLAILLLDYWPSMLNIGRQEHPNFPIWHGIGPVLLALALGVDSESYLHQIIGIRPRSLDLKLTAIGLGLTGAWLAVRVLSRPKRKEGPPARTAIAGGLSASVIFLAFWGPSSIVAAGAGAVALTTVVAATILDRPRPA